MPTAAAIATAATTGVSRIRDQGYSNEKRDRS
jgi:hypothetical protein